MQIRRLVQALHRWLGLLIVAQVLLWMTSGIVMSWFPIELVRGETAMASGFAAELPVQTYVSPGGVLAQVDGATQVTLSTRFGRTVYEVDAVDGKALFDADTGEKLSPLAEDVIRKVAARDFIGEGGITKVELLFDPPYEYRGPEPVWRVSFDDKNATRIYISPETGTVIARRNRIWRIYDFFWMLHIMDYGERENFNNPLIKTLSATGLIFALSGLFLVLSRVDGGRYAGDLKKLFRRRR